MSTARSFRRCTKELSSGGGDGVVMAVDAISKSSDREDELD
jgi:hypothetical protein